MIKTSFHEWQVDNVNLRAGALAFFIIMALPPLLLFIVPVFVRLFLSKPSYSHNYSRNNHGSSISSGKYL